MATLADLLALTIVWGCLLNFRRRLPLGVSVLVSLLAIMWMDSFIFITLAFGNTPDFWPILKGTLVSRSVVALIATPVLTLYLIWEIRRHGWRFQSLPALALFRLGDLEKELKSARHDLVKSTEELQQVEDRYVASVEDMPLMEAPEGADEKRLAKVEAGRARMLAKAQEKYGFQVEPMCSPKEPIVEDGQQPLGVPCRPRALGSHQIAEQLSHDGDPL